MLNFILSIPVDRTWYLKLNWNFHGFRMVKALFSLLELHGMSRTLLRNGGPAGLKTALVSGLSSPALCLPHRPSLYHTVHFWPKCFEFLYSCRGIVGLK